GARRQRLARQDRARQRAKEGHRARRGIALAPAKREPPSGYNLGGSRHARGQNGAGSTVLRCASSAPHSACAVGTSSSSPARMATAAARGAWAPSPELPLSLAPCPFSRPLPTPTVTSPRSSAEA